MDNNNNNDKEFESTVSGLIEFSEEVEKSYLDYAMSVIAGRAIPDAFDGCKPVQRRILYAMNESGYTSEKPYKKSTSTVGEVLGKYHPHGEATVYDAMVRMTQDFSLSVPLIDGQGNFGSIDGDMAAAMRYTESRLAKISKYLIQDYDKDTVPMVPNYDGSLSIPSVLPVVFPNLLVNGANGIAVGMATCIPTHNLHEVIDATCAFIDNQNISLVEIMNFIKGPDLPTKGIISDPNSIRKMYEEGRGSFVIRGVAEVENHNIIITEIPYQVNKSHLIEKIVDLSQTEELKQAIMVVRDESTCEGIRIVIECHKTADPEKLCMQLYSKTQLQIEFHVSMRALDKGIPKLFPLLDFLKTFVDRREEVIIRRTEFFLRTTKAKAHILWGLALAVSKLDEVIACIKSSKNTETAKFNLMSIQWDKTAILPYIELIGETLKNNNENDDFISITEVQAKSILEIRLQSLTGLEREKILSELEELGAKIKQLQSLLDNRENRYQLMKEEMLQIKSEFKAPRRSRICFLDADFDDISVVKEEDCLITVSYAGYIKRVPLDVYRIQRRGGRGKQAVIESDPIEHMFVANTHQEVLIFTNFGYVYSMPVYKVPHGTPTTKGRAIVQILSVKKNEKIAAVMPIDMDMDKNNTKNTKDGNNNSQNNNENSTQETRAFDPLGIIDKVESSAQEDKKEKCLVFVTSKGYVRRNSIDDFRNIRKNGKIAIKLDEGEYLASVSIVEDDDEIMITSSAGKSIRMSVLEVSIIKSRSSRGVIGMQLKKNENVVSVTLITKEQKDSGQNILTITSRGFGKQAKISTYRTTNRGAKGVISTVVNSETGPVIGAYQVSDNSSLLLMNNKGQMIRSMVSEIRVASRVTKGVHLVKLDEGDSIVHAFVISADEDEYDQIPTSIPEAVSE